MKVYIEDQVIEYENNKEEIDDILNEVDNIISKASKILSHMIIDKIEVYENYYDHLLDNIRIIKTIKVISMTYKELVDDILISKLEYLENTPEIITELANRFYKSPTKESWESLTDLLGALSWIINTFTSIDQDNRLRGIVSSYENWNLYAKEIFSLQEILKEFEQALSNNDTILLGDILSHEILPKFEMMVLRLSQLIIKEDAFDDLN